MGRLAGKVAMVTGSGGEHGFGRAIARRLAADGADLVLTDVAPTGTVVVTSKPATGWGGLDAVAAEVRQAGRRALTALVDVRSGAQIGGAVAHVLETFGRLDVLVNNAAAPPGADRVPVVELTETAWDLVLDTNLTGTYLCARAAARAMLAHGIRGRIINMSSNCGKVGYPRMAAYCASKFGVIGFTQALALELAPAGITVNAICPGPADTDRLDFLGRRPDGGYDPALRAAELGRRAEGIPLRRLATAGDVAELTAFLASDAAEYITGQAINVAGGAILH
ncbi:MAG TPA: SDR family NAD(P)-dependent oxidoreductase [Methylomirabilota bacterium]|jgi:NAD(P)-dependent dehydrogenase (short-subunit alcohol dehydrogenase family)|nr:SDR family NAD(P)-dependent oxidoreductase [Methylomirabilota bacterium]